MQNTKQPSYCYQLKCSSEKIEFQVCPPCSPEMPHCLQRAARGQKLGNHQSPSSSKEDTQLCYVEMSWGRQEWEPGEHGFDVSIMMCRAHAPLAESRKCPAGNTAAFLSLKSLIPVSAFYLFIHLDRRSEFLLFLTANWDWPVLPGDRRAGWPVSRVAVPEHKFCSLEAKLQLFRTDFKSLVCSDSGEETPNSQSCKRYQVWVEPMLKNRGLV